MTYALLYSTEFVFGSGSIRDDASSEDPLSHRPGALKLVRDRLPKHVKRAILDFVRKGEASSVLSDGGRRILALIWVAVNGSNGLDLLQEAKDASNENTEDGKREIKLLTDFASLVESISKNDKPN